MRCVLEKEISLMLMMVKLKDGIGKRVFVSGHGSANDKGEKLKKIYFEKIERFARNFEPKLEDKRFRCTDRRGSNTV